jgi:hypothetical protein
MAAVTTKLPADTSSAPLLSLIWPGLGQLYQGRFAHAAHFLVDSAILAMVITVSEPFRGPALLALGAIALWSVVDAFRAERAGTSMTRTAS